MSLGKETFTESSKETSPYLQALSAYLETNGWSSKHCSNCSSSFYTLERSTTFCGSEHCHTPFVDRLSVTSRVDIKTLKAEFETSYTKEGYYISYPLNPVNRNRRWGNTSLVVSGVQRLQPFLDFGAWVPPKIFINQPCVRTQFRGMSDSTDWSSSSFVNPSALIPEASLENHLSGIVSWISCLKNAGVDISKLTLKARRKQETWGQAVFQREVLDFYYCGIHIADASFIDNYPRGQKKVSFSDIGGGLERIAGIVNEGNYYHAHTPPQETINNLYPAFFDAIKALTLILGSDGATQDPDVWQYVKRYFTLLNQYKNKDMLKNLFYTIDYYIYYWNIFIPDERMPNKVDGIKSHFTKYS